MPDTYGTSNILHQYSAFHELEDEYDRDVACRLTSRSFQRHGVPAEPDDVDVWDRLNTAAAQGMLDISVERRHGESMADVVVHTALYRMSEDDDSGEDGVLAEDDYGNNDNYDEQEEWDSLSDIFGYEDDEDNEEAALDTILKNNERVD
ncbi:hypothetical protein [Halomonas sp. I5-271120]|uniref:hypothetical protein n=1 Tax=Halomonas sp. I5-271120 TaxID=3061632 RepID=UPI002714F1E6|nr:hypothetical protein [Halomonas sp. I5-271120]